MIFNKEYFFLKKRLVLDEKVVEMPDLNIQYLREYFNSTVRNDCEKNIFQEMIELCESLFDSKEIAEYCLNSGCVRNEFFYLVVAEMAKLYNIDMLNSMLGNAIVFEVKVKSTLERCVKK